MVTYVKTRKFVALSGFSFLCIFFQLVSTGCKESYRPTTLLQSQYIYYEPDYNKIGLKATRDSLHFSLPDDFYHLINSFNVFQDGGTTYAAFLNKMSHSICIYNVKTGNLERRIYLHDSLVGKKMNNVTTYCWKLDTILTATRHGLYVMDSSGAIKSSIKLLEEKGRKHLGSDFLSSLFQTRLDNTAPPFFDGDILYSSIRPAYATSRSLSAQQNLRLVYCFNKKEEKPSLIYSFPKVYQEGYFGYYYLNFSYCINEKREFVMSFSADPNMYVTDLVDTSRSFWGRSQQQVADIKPFAGEVVEDRREEGDHYAKSGRYGPVFYDQAHKRYLRLFTTGSSRIRQDRQDTTKAASKGYVLIFDDSFRIIGESELPSGISFVQLFITPEGAIYTRTNYNDEKAIHFVRLEYVDERRTNLTEK
ncbi:DUF4221 family protein [Chitinophaga niabensis]|uniref:DUF4221 domain-containing protein n=1 Tax=Chitinophaga niabensis TaxID=536979 RepID=A0A1N6JBR4_9BACT|nr:DUF4221 family protein [Chitinophaga niabensis]SIO41705.1 protein of unknown function [Chitinophaga niabensis]